MSANKESPASSSAPPDSGSENRRPAAEFDLKDYGQSFTSAPEIEAGAQDTEKSFLSSSPAVEAGATGIRAEFSQDPEKTFLSLGPPAIEAGSARITGDLTQDLGLPDQQSLHLLSWPSSPAIEAGGAGISGDLSQDLGLPDQQSLPLLSWAGGAGIAAEFGPEADKNLALSLSLAGQSSTGGRDSRIPPEFERDAAEFPALLRQSAAPEAGGSSLASAASGLRQEARNFNPSDLELLKLLSMKVEKRAIGADVPIYDAELYNHGPQWISENFAASAKNQWYIFCMTKKKYSKGNSIDRSSKDGTWKPHGGITKVMEDGEEVGMKRSLSFQQKNGLKTRWKMIEYRLGGDVSMLTVCKIYLQEQ